MSTAFRKKNWSIFGEKKILEIAKQPYKGLLETLFNNFLVEFS